MEASINDVKAAVDDTKAAIADFRMAFHYEVRRFVRWVVGTAIGFAIVGPSVVTLALNYAPLPENRPVLVLPAQPPLVIIVLSPYTAPPSGH